MGLVIKALASAALVFLSQFATAQELEQVEPEEQAQLQKVLDQLEAYDGPATEDELDAQLAREDYERRAELRKKYDLPAPIIWPHAPPNPPAETEIPDGSGWILKEPLHWSIGQSGHALVVPAGFIHDKASVPQSLQWLIKQTGKYSRAAAVHDFLYWQQDCTRLQSDNLMMILMKESGVLPAIRQMIYRGVRLGGWHAWKSNGAAKSRGVRRVYLGPALTADVTFESIQSELKREAEFAGRTDLDREYTGEISRDICALGNSTRIPESGSPKLAEGDLVSSLHKLGVKPHRVEPWSDEKRGMQGEIIEYVGGGKRIVVHVSDEIIQSIETFED